METIQQLALKVNEARTRFLAILKGLSTAQANYKAAEDSWSITQITEHMVWAEYSGISGMYRAMEGLKNGKPVFAGESVFAGMPIEIIIEKTWKAKEQVPEIAGPHWGGPLSFWIAALQSCEMLLHSLVLELGNYDPEKVIYPHVLSGPLNALQRLEFLRFHLDRHSGQVNAIKGMPGYLECEISPLAM